MSPSPPPPAPSLVTDALDGALVPPRARRFFCNRTLNLRSLRAIGFDMDYTLVHYAVHAWEERAFEHARAGLAARGWPVGDWSFDPELVTRGLVLDLKLGNVVKANRFGYVTRAAHGTRLLEFDEQRRAYSRLLVDLAEPRWVFLNTLFSLSEGSLFSLGVELLDAGALPHAMGYADLYDAVKSCVDAAHVEGELKAEILAAPERYVELDPELPLALLDLKHAGRDLLLVTNSEWGYTDAMMRYVLDPALGGRSWRELFTLIIVQSRKPAFFTAKQPVFEVVDESGLLRPWIGKLRPGGAYLGGHAGLIEQGLGIAPEEILYVGDHMFADVHVSKDILRWRTALVLHELEAEIAAAESFEADQRLLARLMREKREKELRFSQVRLGLQRIEAAYGPRPQAPPERLRQLLQSLRAELVALDQQIAPLARAAGRLVNERWGPLLRAGSDKSLLARQIERYADVYTSRVSNFLVETPFEYLRAPLGQLPHDGSEPG
ncbi:MAG: HAD-IG family 5'-nucleotidase [Polyangiaceae bacterium]|nr:HAD-IG family 5'-nucleotidase [Polyangiaceae bacterium]